MAKVRSETGFTLLELVVAMLLVSMVTVIIAMAFRLALNTWDRVQREGDGFQARIIIPSLLKNQLAGIVREKTFAPGQPPVRLLLTGTETSVSFFTSHTAMAGNQQGLLRVTYVYVPLEKTLFLFQQPVITMDDLAENHFPLSPKWDGELIPAGSIEGVETFRVQYSPFRSFGQVRREETLKSWEDPQSQNFPESLTVYFLVPVPGAGPEPDLWFFTVGI